MFSTFDCAVKGYRQKEDAWNAIISGFMTGGCLAARSECPILVTFLKNLTCLLPLGGPKAAFGSAVACGILLGVFEGVGVLLGRVFSEGQRPQLPPCEYSLWLVLCTTTHLSAALLSTRVYVPTDVTTCCYLILAHILSLLTPALCCISRSFPRLGHWHTLLCFLDYLCNSFSSLNT